MLTDAKARTAKPKDKPYKIPAGRGLYLEIRPTGAKLWRYRYRLPDAAGVLRENLYALGAYGHGGAERGEYSIVEAEAERARVRELVKQGKHPAMERKRERQTNITEAANTFRAVALEWIETKRRARTAGYIKQIESAFRDFVYPAIGDRPIASISPADLAGIVDAKAKAHPTAAILIQQWMGSVFRFAVRRHKITIDPSYAIRGLVERRPIKRKQPLREADLPAFRGALAKCRSARPVVIALSLLLYTFVRPAELRNAKWSEFDLESATWRIPAERMKMREPHTVPLSTQAVALLRELHRFNGENVFLFPNERDGKRPMANTTFNRALVAMGYSGRLTAHGFRTTASTWLNEAGFRPDVIERQLAHKERNAVRAAYNRAEHLPERRQMMQQWADVVDTAGASNVVPINAKAAA